MNQFLSVLFCFGILGQTAWANLPLEWQKAGFGHVKISTLQTPWLGANSDPKPELSKELRLTLVHFRESGWLEPEIADQLSKAGRALSLCGIRIAEITRIDADALGGKLDIEGPFHSNDHADTAELEITNALPTRARPILFLMRHGSAHSPAYAGLESYFGPQHPLLNTLWISRDTLVPNHANIPLIHELGHLLQNFPGHSLYPSVMGQNAQLLNDQLSVEQCEQMRSSPFLSAVRE